MLQGGLTAVFHGVMRAGPVLPLAQVSEQRLKGQLETAKAEAEKHASEADFQRKFSQAQARRPPRPICSGSKTFGSTLEHIRAPLALLKRLSEETICQGAEDDFV